MSKDRDTIGERFTMEDKLLSGVGRYVFQAEPFHCDCSYRLFLAHLGNQLLNAADFHSNERGYGVRVLAICIERGCCHVSHWRFIICPKFMRALRLRPG